MGLSLRSAPSRHQKLKLLGEAAQYDLACACGPSLARVVGPGGRWVYPAVLPTGGRAFLLKVLQEGGCERGCAYCAQRHGAEGSPGAAARFTPEELARLFQELLEARRVEGLFLSSAIRGGARATMDRMLATAELVRRRGFRGYLHLKIIPGSQPSQIDRALELATRVSVNLELPTERHLRAVAPSKQLHGQIVTAMRHVATAERRGRFRRAGQTTQLVVGASDESDLEIGRASEWLYRRLGLRRVYYSGFQPMPGTPLAHRVPSLPLREHRLYQLDFLLRRYGFALDEVPFDDQGQLSLAQDPKTAWAQRHPERFPLEVNTAAPEELMRVPGIGPTSARRLVQLRQRGRLRSVAALRAAGASPQCAAPYLLLDGRRGAPEQLPLAGPGW